MPAAPQSRMAFGFIPWYSLLIVVAIALAVYLCGREEKRLGLPKDTAIDSALWAIPFGIVGARLYYVAFSWEQFAREPLRILYVWEGGVAIYGALLGGLIGVWIHARRKKIPLASLLDMIIPSVALAQALGRWGNYFNMEAYGEAVLNPAWQFFPFAVWIPDSGAGTWHLATFFYESCWDVITFLLLMAGRKRMYRRGDVFLWYILLYGAGRAVVEGLRLDSLWLNETIRASQGLSLLGQFAVLLWLALRLFKHGGQVIPPLSAVLFSLALLCLFGIGGDLQALLLFKVLLAALVCLCALGIALPGLQKQGRRLLPAALPLFALAACLAVFLFFYQGTHDTLLMQTIFVILIAFSFPAAALAVYPAAHKE